MRILLLEDNGLDADLVRLALADVEMACGLVVAETLASARRHLADREAGFDLLLTDLRLPDGDGLELVAELRARGEAITVVAMTSQGDEAVALAALRAGADDYLVKRNDLHERLTPTLRAAYQRRMSEHARRSRVLRVLYAEPQALDVDLTRRHLAAHAPHLQLQVVPDAQAALDRLPLAPGQACQFDVLLIDYRLPGDSGLDLLKTVREARGLDLAVVMATGQGSEDVAAEALRLGATDYLPKQGQYLQLLPLAIENAYHRVAAAREHAALLQLNAELEQRVAERTRALETSNRELDAFAYSVSHDLRAPLRAIDGLSTLLLRDYEAVIDADGQRLLGLLRDSALRMDRQIRDLLAFARSAREPLQRAAVDAADLVQRCLAERHDEITRRGVSVQVAPLPVVQADARLLQQVFANLLDNALKFTRHQAAPRIEVAAQPAADGAIEFTVRDNGAGFDMRYAGKLFNVFQRLHRADEFEGNGVGLAIAARIVDRHGGRIAAEGKPGQGACLRFSLADTGGALSAPPAAATES